MSREKLSVVSTEPSFENHDFDIVGKMPISFRKNKIIFATSKEGVSVVIKITTSLKEANKEWVGLYKNHQAKIPVPTPFILGVTNSGEPCVVMERLYGKPLFLYHKDEARVELGKTVKQIHTRVKIEGSEWQESEIANFTFYDKKINMWSKNKDQMGEFSSVTQSLFQSLTSPMVDYCITTSPVFNHNDIHDGQVLKSGKKVGAIVDFGDWMENHPLNDVGYYLFHCLRTNKEFVNFSPFMQGYLEGKTLNENEKQALIYTLLFISTRSIIKFHNFKVGYLETAKTTHQKVLEFIEKELLWKLL